MIYMDGSRPMGQAPGAGPAFIAIATLFTAVTVVHNIGAQNRLRDGARAVPPGVVDQVARVIHAPEVVDQVKRVIQVVVEYLNPEEFWDAVTPEAAATCLASAAPSVCENTQRVAELTQAAYTALYPLIENPISNILQCALPQGTQCPLREPVLNVTALPERVAPLALVVQEHVVSTARQIPQPFITHFADSRTGTMASPPPAVGLTLMERATSAATVGLGALTSLGDTLTTLGEDISKGFTLAVTTMDQSILFKPIGGIKMSTLFGLAAQAYGADALTRIAGDHLTLPLAKTDAATSIARLLPGSDAEKTARLVSRVALEAGATAIIVFAGGGTCAILGSMHCSSTRALDDVKDRPLSTEYPSLTENRVIVAVSIVSGGATYFVASNILPPTLAAPLAVGVAKVSAFALNELRKMFG